MNERIEKLVKQATKHYPATKSSGEFSTFDKEKFAELLINESCELLLKWKHEPFPFDEDVACSILKDYWNIK